MQISGFFRCPCGKLHAVAGLWFGSQCPECRRDLMMVREGMSKPLPPRVVTSMSYWVQREREPREACPNCSFEVPKGTLGEHVCNG